MSGTQKVPFRRRQLCRLLRQLRDEAGMTLEDAGERLRFSKSKLSRLETVQVPGFHELRAMLDLYGVIVNDWAPIITLWERATERGWWHAYGIDDKGYVSVEADASRIREYTNGLVPGLLQAEGYMRALFASNASLSLEDIETAVEVRQIRQRRLIEGDDLELHVIIDELVLYRHGLTAEDWESQLNQLIEIAQLPNVRAQIVPLRIGMHVGQSGSFSVLSFPDRNEPDLAYVEHPFGSVHVEDSKEVSAAKVKFDHLADVALDEQDTLALVRERIATG